MYTVSYFFTIYITVRLTLLCVLFDFIEFTSRFAGKVYPYTRIKQRKYRKSPEGLTKSVRFSGLFFLSPESVFKRVTQGNRKNQERM